MNVMIAADTTTRVEVAGFTVDMRRDLLLDDQGDIVEMRPQAWLVLRHLALHAGRLVTKDELMTAVWSGVVVTDDSLVQAVGDVRRALGAAGRDAVRTIPRRGYMLVATTASSTSASGRTFATGGAPLPGRAATSDGDTAPTKPVPAHAFAARLPSASAVAATASPVDATAIASARSPFAASPLALPTRRWPAIAWVGLAALVAIVGSVGWSLATRALSGTGQTAATPFGPGAQPSVAVLPFRDPMHNADGDALGRVIAADLVSELARSPDLRVASHQSSFQFASAQAVTPPAEIGRRLQSRYLVDGTVRREGEQLRLSIDLLDSASGQVLWTSASQLLSADAIGATERALVGRIAGTLQSRVMRTEERRVLAQPPKSLDVVVLTERGRTSMQRYDADGMREARRLLEQAVQVDPAYAPAWVYLGMTNTIDAGLRLTGEWTQARMPEVLVQVNRAVALQPDLPVAYIALSQAQSLARNQGAALAAAQRCMQLSPNDGDCFYILGKTQLEGGQSQPAVQNLAQAVERNPLAPAYLPAFYATALWAENRFDEAIHVADRCLSLAPAFWRCRQDRIAALVGLGRVAEARDEAKRLRTQVPAMTALQFGNVLHESAEALRDRRVDAAVQAGMP